MKSEKRVTSNRFIQFERNINLLNDKQKSLFLFIDTLQLDKGVVCQ